jgi:hypothetical protein
MLIRIQDRPMPSILAHMSLSKSSLGGTWMMATIPWLLVSSVPRVGYRRSMHPLGGNGSNWKTEILTFSEALSGAAATITSDALMNPFDGELIPRLIIGYRL